MSKRERNQESSIYIGNLDDKMTESLLYELFIQVGPVVSIHLPKDRILKTHQGYGFIEFENQHDVEYAEKVLQGIRLYGKSLKINRVGTTISTTAKKSTEEGEENNNNNNKNKKKHTRDLVELGCTLFVNHLDSMSTEELLTSIFKQFGELYKPVELKESKTSKYAFIYYKNFRDSDLALEKMHNQFILDKKIHVDYAMDHEKGVKHGSQIERLLLEKAQQNNYTI